MLEIFSGLRLEVFVAERTDAGYDDYNEWGDEEDRVFADSDLEEATTDTVRVCVCVCACVFLCCCV